MRKRKTVGTIIASMLVTAALLLSGILSGCSCNRGTLDPSEAEKECTEESVDASETASDNETSDSDESQETTEEKLDTGHGADVIEVEVTDSEDEGEDIDIPSEDNTDLPDESRSDEQESNGSDAPEETTEDSNELPEIPA